MTTHSPSPLHEACSTINYCYISYNSHYLKEKAASDVNYKECALIIDAMAIKTSIINDKTTGRFIGFTDFGENNVACDPDIPATEALVFMLVGLRGHWKMPIGYILCDK